MKKEKTNTITRCSVTILILWLLVLSACASVTLDKTLTLDELEMLNEVDRIDVYGSDQNEDGVWEQHLIKTIENPEQINTIVMAFRTKADNWQVGQFKPYLPGRVTVSFYHKNEVKTSIMIVSYNRVGENEGMSYFLSKLYGPIRPMEASEFKELIGFLGISEEVAYYGFLKSSIAAP